MLRLPRHLIWSSLTRYASRLDPGTKEPLTSGALTILSLVFWSALAVCLEAWPGRIETFTPQQLGFHCEHILHPMILAQGVPAAGLHGSHLATRLIRLHISSSNHGGCPFCPRRRRAMSNA
jgi:hypothetical protein